MLGSVALEGAVYIRRGDREAEEDGEEVDREQAILEITEAGIERVTALHEHAEGHAEEELSHTLQEYDGDHKRAVLKDGGHKEACTNGHDKHDHEASTGKSEAVEGRLEIVPIAGVSTGDGMKDERGNGEGLERWIRPSRAKKNEEGRRGAHSVEEK